MNVLKISILERESGADHVSLYTDYPAPIICFPDELLILDFRVTKGYGRKYVEDNFPGISVEIING
jgi:hypothetical protein